MAKMKIGRTTSQTTPPDNYKKYQSDSTSYVEQSKFYGANNFDLKTFGNPGMGKPKKAKPSTVEMYNKSFRSKGEPAAKDIYLSQYGSDEMFIEKTKNKESHSFPGIVYEKPVKPTPVVKSKSKDVKPSITKNAVEASSLVYASPDLTFKAQKKEDTSLPSSMPIKRSTVTPNIKQSLQGSYEGPAAPEYIQPGYKRENRKGGMSPTLASKIVQKLTGYNKDYMEGTNGNFGEIDKSKGWDISTSTKTGMPTETPRRTEFQGASSLRDLKAQKKYNKEFDKYQAKQDQMNAYSSMFNNPANLNTIDSQLEKLKK